MIVFWIVYKLQYSIYTVLNTGNLLSVFVVLFNSLKSIQFNSVFVLLTVVWYIYIHVRWWIGIDGLSEMRSSVNWYYRYTVFICATIFYLYLLENKRDPTSLIKIPCVLSTTGTFTAKYTLLTQEIDLLLIYYCTVTLYKY